MTATVVILLSDKRSGSTVFERELCKHRDVKHIHFTPHTYNETHYWVKAACILPTTAEDFSGGVRPDSYGSSTAARKSLFRTIQANVLNFVAPDDDELLVFEGWEALCRQFAQPIFFEKSPHHVHHWAALDLMSRWIENTDFRVRIIGLVRNPMAVMHSALQLFYTDPQPRQFGWVYANRNILRMAKLLGVEQFKLVRYEDLVKSPAKGFRDICDFIGIEYQNQIGASVNTHSLFKWRDDQAFDFQLDKSVATFAQSLGYSKADLCNPPKPQAGPLQRINRILFLGFKRAQSRLYNKVKRFSN